MSHLFLHQPDPGQKNSGPALILSPSESFCKHGLACFSSLVGSGRVALERTRAPGVGRVGSSVNAGASLLRISDLPVKAEPPDPANGAALSR